MNKDKTPPKGAVRFSLSLSPEQKQAKTEILKHPFSFIVGKAGSGKTLLAAACGLEQVINGTGYDKLIITRPVQPMGRDIGFLPGSLEEKMMPWIAPLRDKDCFL